LTDSAQKSTSLLGYMVFATHKWLVKLDSSIKIGIFGAQRRGIMVDSVEGAAQWKADRMYQFVSIEQNPFNPSSTLSIRFDL
jgi:hypothetical protein